MHISHIQYIGDKLLMQLTQECKLLEEIYLIRTNSFKIFLKEINFSEITTGNKNRVRQEKLTIGRKTNNKESTNWTGWCHVTMIEQLGNDYLYSSQT